MSDLVDIENLSHDGRGVGRSQGKAVFVEGALPQERVHIQLLHQHRHYDEAQVLSYETQSPFRIEPECAHFSSCGGCVLQHLEPTQQLKIKEQNFWHNLKKLSNLEPRKKLEAIRGPVTGYRHRVKFHLQTLLGAVGLGFQPKDHGPSLVLIKDCCVLVRELRPFIPLLQAFLTQCHDVSSIEFIELIQAKEGCVLLFKLRQNLSAYDKAQWINFAAQHSLIFMTKLPDQSLQCHTHELSTLQLTYPFPTRTERMQFLPGDFTQINPWMNEAMLTSAVSMMNLQKTDRIGDWCGGIGNFALACAPHVEAVFGAELSSSMVLRANQNAALNDNTHVQFELVDMEKTWAIDRFFRQHRMNRLIIDPPRQGAQALVEQLSPKKIQGILYVSCHPATFARDAKILTQKKFKFKSARVLDMFPHTAHLEVMAWFEG